VIRAANIKPSPPKRSASVGAVAAFQRVIALVAEEGFRWRSRSPNPLPARAASGGGSR
jgi:hypothetical protein